VAVTTPAGRDISLDAKYLSDEGPIFLTGVQAHVRAILDQLRLDRRAGRNTSAFVSGYQGSPLGTFDREVSRQRHLAPDGALVHVPALNEELAATSVYGTQLVDQLPGPRADGVFGVWYGKGPGLDRAGDAIRHGNFVGASPTGGMVALVGDDPGAKSSTIPSASEATLAALQVPTLYPGRLDEVLRFGLHAVACSRTSGLWTAIKSVTNIADGAGTATPPDDAFAPVIPELEWRGRPFVHAPSGKLLQAQSLESEATMFGARLPLAKLYARANALNALAVDPAGARLGIVAAGKTFYDLRQACALLGLDDDRLERLGIRLLRIGMLYPLDEEIVRDLARGAAQVLVVEEKGPWLERAVRDALYDVPDRPRILGRLDAEGRPLVPGAGELDGDLIAAALARVVGPLLPGGERLAERPAPPTAPAAPIDLPARSPFFCSGCPHNRSTDVPDGTQVGVGIGCHTMVLLTREGKGELTGLTQMGGEGAQWIGMAPFTQTAHFVQNIGDGTFHHSGSLAVRAAVAAGVNITYKLLYNSAVAMTGGQAVEGVLAVPDLVRGLAAEGVKRIIVTAEEPERYRGVALAPIASVRGRDALLDAQRELAAVPGVTVLIHDQRCAAEKRRLRKRGKLADPPQRVVIEERVCEGCGDCGRKSDCLSVRPVETEYGRKTQIHQASCNKDFSCLEGDCPSFVTVLPPRRRPREQPAAAHPEPPANLPEPEPRVPAADCTIRMIGIGGTGVVTISQVVGVAAMLDGRHVWSLDQTGLSQKGGPVASDVRFADAPIAGANKATAGGADVYLGFDLLGAAAPRNLATASPDRTLAVVSTSAIPTGQMVIDPAAAFPAEPGVLAPIEAATRRDENVYLDTQRLSQALFADDMPANALLLGAAYQAGALPIGADAIERAFRLNGAAVQRNLAAFAWGRAAVADPAAVAALLADDGPPPRTADELVAARAAELRRYQDDRCARRYTEAVRRVAAAAGERAPEAADAITTAFAEGLFKLTAYKDEYEVARLHLEGADRARAASGYGPDARIAWHLHPPVLRGLGMRRKVRLGEWFTPAFTALHRARRLRGTRLDPFGRTEVRRTERALPAEYEAIVADALRHLTPHNAPAVAELCALPDVVRGYEDIKLEAVARFRAEAADRLRAVSG
jgi:indolepyruvate ferredoxin oxidoreductase